MLAVGAVVKIHDFNSTTIRPALQPLVDGLGSIANPSPPCATAWSSKPTTPAESHCALPTIRTTNSFANSSSFSAFRHSRQSGERRICMPRSAAGIGAITYRSYPGRRAGRKADSCR
jgi:hypothetical protein